MNFKDLKAIADATPIAETTAELPRLYWRNGAMALNTPGVFYIKAEELNEAPDVADWQSIEKYRDEQGYSAEHAFIACVGYRQQPFMVDRTDPKNKVTTWLPRYEKGAQFYTEMLCAVRGLDEMVVLIVKGLGGRAMVGKGGVLYQHQKTAQDIGRAVGARFNPWAFWMEVGGALDKKGRPDYTATGHSSFVTLPTLYESHRELGIEAMAASQFVGEGLYADLTSAQQTYKANRWFAQRRGNVVADEQPDASYHPTDATDPESDNTLF